MKPKIIAYYLPQYHEIPENNEWWGKGFTEWTNVKNCKPVFKGQIQPKVPLNNNYYDLMDKKTVEWQTNLANDYGIYGFCYFHYWFKNGRKILEKPAENLLNWKDIPQRFCFFWANAQWQRTWSNSKVPATEWTPIDKQIAGDNKAVLLEQDYGTEKEWEQHFEYLLPFFQDERYIKVNNKPFFAIYNMDLIDCSNEMFALWNKLAKENGFDGIHFVSVNQNCPNNPYVEAILQYGSGILKHSTSYRIRSLIRRCNNFALRKLHLKFQFYQVWNYKYIWKCITSVKPYGNVPNYAGGDVHYDDTPRRGKRALYYKNANAKTFEKFLSKQLSRAEKIYKTDFLFLDAWNEWGEGNYLEPDELYGYSFLEALKRSVNK